MGGGGGSGKSGPREEREAVRGPEGQGDVEGARGEDRQLARCVEAGGERSHTAKSNQAGGTHAQKSLRPKGGKADGKENGHRERGGFSWAPLAHQGGSRLTCGSR